jgi:general secretion pathway protein D
MRKTAYSLTQLVMALLLVSCASEPPTEAVPDSGSGFEAVAGDSKPDIQADDAGSDSQQAESPGESKGDTIRKGSGVFVQATGNGQPNGYADGDGVTLNFENASLPEFLRVVFESILKENYLIDPSVSGTVTLHTTRPVTADTVLPIVEAVLEQNGAALIRDEGMFKVLPMAGASSAAGSPAVGRYPSSRRKGYGIQVVPLQHVSAGELMEILAPFVPDGSSIAVDTTRNVLILSGPRYRLDDLLATVRMFDVDWLKGMSFAMFRLEYADAVSVVEEIETIIDSGGETPLAGIVRVLPIERVNGVLVITHRPDHIDAIQNLIEEFDWGLEGSSGRRLFVYELENGKAENIASVLQQIFGQKELEGSGSGEFAVPGAPSSVFRGADAVTRPPPAPGQSSANRVVRPTTTTATTSASSAEVDGAW